MPDATLEGLVDRFLAAHAAARPVDATFMGLPGWNGRWTPTDADAPAREREALDGIARDLARLPTPGAGDAWVEWRMLQACLAEERLALDARPRWGVPSFYTGEVAFGLISLLLPSAPPDAAEALSERLNGVVAFLTGATHHLRAAHPDWITRTRREAAAIDRLLAEGLPRHPIWRGGLDDAVASARQALGRFAVDLDRLPPAEVAIGSDALRVLMADCHALPWTADDALVLATDAFARLSDEIDRVAAEIDPAQSATAQLAALSARHPGIDAFPAIYTQWHARAMTEAGRLVTPAEGYGLDFRFLPEWARPIAGDLYFLSYRCPPAERAGDGSVYWIGAPGPDPAAYLATQATVAIKQTHAVHHGSIGHHTQNARARVAGSRLARLAGTDCAAGIAWVAAGTMVEGWSCYATDLMAEVDGFYDPAERLALIQAERRNAASVIADISLHTGRWNLAQMRAFYRDEARFPAARVWSETTRNAILPATRLMYFLGTEQIKALRREIGGDTRAFHDRLLSFGHVPIAVAAAAMRRERTSPA